MCKGTCHTAISALLTYVLTTRIGFCKLWIFICGLVSSALVGATFIKGLGDFFTHFFTQFVLFATTWW